MLLTAAKPLCVSLLLALVLGLPARAGSVAQIGTDERLQSRVTLSHRLITLEEGVRQIARGTGVALRVDPAVAGENVVLLVRGRPAGEVLDVLGTTLGYEWRQTQSSGPPRYELSWPAAARTREARIQRARRQRSLELILEQCRQRGMLAALSARSPAEYRTRRDAILAAVGNPGLSAEERARLTSEARWWREEPLDGVKGTLLRVFARLAASCAALLQNDQVVKHSSSRAEGLLPLPGWAARELLDARAYRSPDFARAVAGNSVEVRLLSRVQWMPATARLALYEECIRGAAETRQTGVGFRVRPPREDTPVPGSVEDERLRRKLRVSLPAKQPRAAEPASYFQQHLLVDFLAFLHERVPEVNFVGDAYVHPDNLTASFSTAGEESLQQWVQRGCDAVDRRWQWDPRGYIGVRSNNVGEERRNSIPASLLQALYRQAEVQRGLKLADLARYGTLLTDAQLDYLVLNEDQRSPGLTLPHTVRAADSLREGRALWRFLAALSPGQWRALQSGGLSLRGGELSPAQQVLVRHLLDDRVWDGAGWPIKGWPLAEIRTMHFQFEPPGSDGRLDSRAFRVRYGWLDALRAGESRGFNVP